MREYISWIDAPLDPLSFEQDSIEERAARLEQAIRPGQSNTKIESGQIITLHCPPNELERRLISKNKFWKKETIQQNTDNIATLYRNEPTIISSYDNDIPQMSKALAKLIFFEKFKPTDIDAILVSKLSK